MIVSNFMKVTIRTSVLSDCANKLQTLWRKIKGSGCLLSVRILSILLSSLSTLEINVHFCTLFITKFELLELHLKVYLFQRMFEFNQVCLGPSLYS